MRVQLIVLGLAAMLASPTLVQAQPAPVTIPNGLPVDAAGVTSVCGAILPDTSPAPRHHRQQARLEVAQASAVSAMADQNWMAASTAYWGALAYHPIVARAIEVLSALSHLESERRAGSRACALTACLLARTDLSADQRTSLDRTDREIGCHPASVVIPPVPVVVPPVPVVEQPIVLMDEERLAVIADVALFHEINGDRDTIVDVQGQYHVDPRFRSRIAGALARYRARPRPAPVVVSTPHPRPTIPVVTVSRRSTLGYAFPIVSGALALGGWITFGYATVTASSLNDELALTQSGRTIGVRPGLEAEASRVFALANGSFAASLGLSALSLSSILIFRPAAPHRMTVAPLGGRDVTGLMVGGTF